MKYGKYRWHKLKYRWKRFWELMEGNECSCNIHRCTEMNLLELKIIKDALKDYDPEDDMWDERTSAYKYMYDMEDLEEVRNRIDKIVKERI